MTEEVKANDVQIGGRHYKTKYEHWDLVFDTGMGYFDGQVTRYVTRWRNKDGVEALKKARHFILKMKELGPRSWPARRQFDYGLIRRYVMENELHEFEIVIIETMAHGPSGGDIALDRVLKLLDVLIASAEQDSTGAPRTDSNKHAHGVQE
jgi:hypothetical protein